MVDMKNTSPSIEGATSNSQQDFQRGVRFWAVIIGLGITTLLAALEHTVVTTSAPMILTDLQLRENFVWVTNAFFICRFVSLVKNF